MAKYGWKEGQGLGREEQGLSTCLQVEKTGKRAGKIINKDVEKAKDGFVMPALPPPASSMLPTTPATPPRPQESTSQSSDISITDLMKNPSKVVLLKVRTYSPTLSKA